jgi:hypothetical protein
MKEWTNLRLKFPPTTMVDEQKLFITILKYSCLREVHLWGTAISDIENDEFTVEVDWDYDNYLEDELKSITLFLEQDPLIEIGRERVNE